MTYSQVWGKGEREREVVCGRVWWPILGICALHLTHPKCTHTAVNTHPEQWAAIYAAPPGEQLGVRCLAQGHLSRGIEGGERCTFTPPTYNSCRTWDSNSQPLDYESDSLTTIRPWIGSLWAKSTALMWTFDTKMRTSTKTLIVFFACSSLMPKHINSKFDR